MHFPSKRELLEATRLTRAGRLHEATAILQTALASAPTVTPKQDTKRAGPLVNNLGKALRSLFGKGGAQPMPAGKSNDPAVERVPAGQFLERRFSNTAGTRPYKLYVPDRLHGRTQDRVSAPPLLVMLHGCTQSPDDFAAGTHMNALAEIHGCLVAYPGQISSANNAKCWNWFNTEDQHRDRGEPSLIAGITREVMGAYGVDPGRVYVAGMSAGGAAAAIMGDAYPDVYAAIGVHSGLACGAARDLPSALAAMRNGTSPPVRPAALATKRLMPTIVFHGTRDSTVHPTNADAVIKQIVGAKKLFVTELPGQVPGGRAYRRILYKDATDTTMLEQWLVEGAGHAWSGGSEAGTYTDPLGPDASQEMLRFFLEHRCPGI